MLLVEGCYDVLMQNLMATPNQSQVHNIFYFLNYLQLELPNIDYCLHVSFDFCFSEMFLFSFENENWFVWKLQNNRSFAKVIIGSSWFYWFAFESKNKIPRLHPYILGRFCGIFFNHHSMKIGQQINIGSRLCCQECKMFSSSKGNRRHDTGYLFYFFIFYGSL